MKVIDAQIHLWKQHVEVIPPHRSEPFGIDEAVREMDRAGVHGAVIHPPSWDLGSHALALEAALRYPDRFAILGRIAPEAPDRLEQLSTWTAQPGVCGLRYTFLKPHEKTWLDDGILDWLWPAAEERTIPIALLADGYLAHVARIAERHPALKLIVDHFGVRRGNVDDAAFASLPEVVALARFPNVAVKITGGPQYVSDAYPFASLRDRYRAIHDAFGPRRMFWGTDITRMPCTWAECVSAFIQHQPWLPQADMDWVMGRGIAEWIGWQREDWS
jgi:predicted TIM-barrel fold metal-dependent hydrolase